MHNPFTSRSSTISGPGTDYLPVTPSDTNDLSDIAVSLYVENGGDVTFHSIRGTQRTVAVGDNSWLLCGVSRVFETGTTATGLHAVVIG
ncbi:hypothetical protein SAMN06273572_11131 [Monaibacterium marinum]|uniref:Uncharacterized protein n=1 Tax=Pontivivens marinum TaxID=1690039 RepID=A0A2C9CW07_9RHOB|nr:hypothetical protein [Monaibacterium marinum]SOH95452.1 hypothetical protein SAMN06273572_11131 [Monaibacterium marinum]